MLEKGTVETFIVSSLYCCCIVETGMLASFTEMGACVPAMPGLLVVVPLLVAGRKMPIKNYKLECARQLQFHLGMTIKTSDMDAQKEKLTKVKSLIVEARVHRLTTGFYRI